jgi:hypothetical protein
MPDKNVEKEDKAQELGKLEKPEAAKFKEGRKLIFVPLVFSMHEHDPEFDKLNNKYWEQVIEQVNKLQEKLVDVTRIYHEFIPDDGEGGVKAIDKMDTGTNKVIKSLVTKGATVMAAESADLLDEFMDWNRCLSLRLSNQGVFTKLVQFYNDAQKKREEWIAKSIDGTLGSEEFGIIFMRENHKVQFPTDIEVFYVAPPSLDEIKRWVRERQSAPPKVKTEDKKAEDKKPEEKKVEEKKSAEEKPAGKKPAAKKTTDKKEK